MKKKRSKKKINFLKENYSKSWDYLKESKKFICIIILIFLIFSLIGFFVPVPEGITKIILEFIKKILEQTRGMSQGELIGFIFFNNLQSSFLGMIFGVLLGIAPIIATISNGYLLGFVALMSVKSEGFFALWKLLPHGIFELPAIFISFGLGLRLGLWLILEPVKFYWVRNKLISFLFLLFYLPTLLITLYFDKQFRFRMKQSLKIFPVNFSNSLRVFLFVVFPLLIIAAIIEGSLIFLFG